jgi:hypothetical protein
VELSDRVAADPRDSELRSLRARVAQLEEELFEYAARSNAAVAAAEERAYWLDRWHVDLNDLMKRRGAAQLRDALRVARAIVRRLRAVQRRLTG